MALLASIPGLDLDDAGVRAWLFEMHRREAIKLVKARASSASTYSASS